MNIRARSKAKGFVLLELIIATAMASIISIVLITSINILNKSISRLEEHLSFFVRSITARYILERDFSAAYIPYNAYQTRQQRSQAQQVAPPAQGQSARAQYKDVFVGKSTDQIPLLISCITANTFSFDDSKQEPAPQIRLHRVVYRLVPEKNATNTFSLVRQQGTEIDLDVYITEANAPVKYRLHPVITDIKECSATYVWREQEVNAQPGQNTPATSQMSGGIPVTQREYRKSTTWPPPESQSANRTVVDRVPLFPERIQWRFVLWHRDKKRYQAFTLDVPLLVDSAVTSPQSLSQSVPSPSQSGTGNAATGNLFQDFFGMSRDTLQQQIQQQMGTP